MTAHYSPGRDPVLIVGAGEAVSGTVILRADAGVLRPTPVSLSCSQRL